jgi:hypothetical protein
MRITRLEAVPESIRNRRFELTDPEHGTAGTLHLTTDARLHFDNANYLLRRNGMLGSFVMTRTGLEIASAKKPLFRRRRFEIEYENERYEVVSTDAGTSYDIRRDDGVRIGVISSERGKCARLRASDGMPRPLACFCMWLSLRQFKQRPTNRSS